MVSDLSVPLLGIITPQMRGRFTPQLGVFTSDAAKSKWRNTKRNEISPILFRESEIWCEIRNEIFKAKFREIRNFLRNF